MSYMRMTMALAWKDARQIVVFWSALISLIVLTHFGIVARLFSKDAIVLVFVAPAIMGLAVGSLLVGREQEGKNHQWLEALPMPRVQLALMTAEPAHGPARGRVLRRRLRG
jgi:hypothetical protein